MEQHPVPQNVTTFQFRLIGDMTLKQFGYLCAGAILAFIAYKLPFPFIITWPLTFLFAFLGVGFAFIPIEERPMDVWVFSFFKRVYSPTQYIWMRDTTPVQPKKHDAPPPLPTPLAAKEAPMSSLNTATTLSASVSAHPTPMINQAPANQINPPTKAPTPTAPTAPKSAISGLFTPTSPMAPAINQSVPQTQPKPKKLSLLDQLISWFIIKPTPVAPPAPPSTPTQPQPTYVVPSVTGRKPEPPSIQAQDDAIHKKMLQLEDVVAKLQEQLAAKSESESKIAALQKQLEDVQAQKSKTEAELDSLRSTKPTQQAASEKVAEPPPNTPKPPPKNGAGSTVNVITTQEAAVKVGLPRLTNTPNVVTGLVKDDAGNLLPGILVTVLNKEEVPVRALKTNKLGQFFASTPLPSGVYFVEIEDPRNRFTFTRVQITLNGTAVPVLEVIAKSEKQLSREKLTQQIFGNPTE